MGIGLGQIAARGRNRVRVFRFLGSLTVALYLLGFVSSYIHLSTIVHVRCKEHGRLIHLGHARYHTSDASLHASRPTQSRRWQDLPPGAELLGYRHAHCCAASHLAARHLQSPPGAALAAATPLSPIEPAPLVGSRPGPRVCLYLLAPKQGPPTV